MSNSFTSKNLPEAARSIASDYKAMMGPANLDLSERLDIHTVSVLNRLNAAHGGRLSALLNGTAPVATDQAPEVTDEDVALALEALYEHGGTLSAVLAADRARVRQTHRPKAEPVEPVRFALEKVTDEQFKRAYRRASLAAAGRPADTPDWVGVSFRTEDFPKHFRAEPAKILPVAEPPKLWAELPEEALEKALYEAQIARNVALAAEGGNERQAADKAAVASLRASLSAYAPPPRKIEPVAEAERLKGEVERLTKERDEARVMAGIWLIRDEAASDSDLRQELNALRAHAAKLEAMLTVPGVGGPVKTWLPYQALRDGKWSDEYFEKMEIEVPVRQTPPASEQVKCWKIKPADEDAIDTIITKPMTRHEAAKHGEVIGEAE